MELTQEILKDLLNYDPDSGVFKWLKSGPGRKSTLIAGTLHKFGYWQITISRKIYKSHRLAWLYEYGKWPDNDVDHKDTIRHHNWISNLREATRCENLQNMVNAKKNNKSTGLLGASFDKRRLSYRSTIFLNYKQKHLGTFKTAQEAHERYLQEKRIIHPFGEI